jgi:N-acetylmuramoyl-L-alanine amidase
MNRLFPTPLVLLVVAALLCGGAGTVHAGWERVKVGKNTYVTLKSFCEFYGLKKNVLDAEKIQLTGAAGEVQIKLNSRETYVNGKKAWLSFNLIPSETGDWLISQIDVSKFYDPLLRGSELSLKPVKGVIIDPGHGGADNGANSRTGYMEKTGTLDTAKRLQRILTEQGIPTVMTRQSDVFIPLEDRAAFGERYPGYVFVSLHFNCGPRESNGVETFALTPQYSGSTDAGGTIRISDATRESGNRTDEGNVLLAYFIHSEVTKYHSDEGDRGLKRARFVVLRKNTVPSTLVEGGFLTNKIDGSLISSESYREKLAGAVARGVQRYIALAAGKTAAPPKPQLRADPVTPQLRREEPAKPDVAPVPPPAPVISPAKTDSKPVAPPVESKPVLEKHEPVIVPEPEPKPAAVPAPAPPVAEPAKEPVLKLTVPPALKASEPEKPAAKTKEDAALNQTRQELQKAVEAVAPEREKAAPSGQPVIETLPAPASPVAPVQEHKEPAPTVTAKPAGDAFGAPAEKKATP